MKAKQKEIAKQAAQKKLGFRASKKLPLVLIATERLSEPEKKMLTALVDGLLTQEAQLALAGSEPLSEHKLPMTEINDELLLGADMMIFLSSELSTISTIQKALSKGAVPISYNFTNCSVFPLTDYDPVKQKGNSFLYDRFNVWSVFAAFVRALENYKFPYDWGMIQGRGEEELN